MDDFSHLNSIEKLGERMLAARNTVGGEFKALAERVGLSTDALSRYFRGEREIGAVSLARYAAAVGLTPNALLMKVAPDSLDAAEFPRFPAAKRALVVQLLTELFDIDHLMPPEFDALQEDVEMHRRLAAKARKLRAADPETAALALASEDPAEYGGRLPNPPVEARAFLAMQRAMMALDADSPEWQALAETSRALAVKSGLRGLDDGPDRDSVGAGSEGVVAGVGEASKRIPKQKHTKRGAK